MTFEEALKIKKTWEPHHFSEGAKYVARVVPSLQEDYNRFSNDLRNFSISDEEVKRYSSNNDFEVRGFASSVFHVE